MNKKSPYKENSRKLIRLCKYDYSKTGWYFVTFCTQNRMPIFGEIVDGKMTLNQHGHLAKRIWKNGKRTWKGIHLDAFIIMPDHIHAIIAIKYKPAGATPRVVHYIRHQSPTNTKHTEITLRDSSMIRATRGVAPAAHPNGPTQKSIGAIIGSYKSTVSKIFHKIQNTHYSIWQRNYQDWIIRDEQHLQNIRKYIQMNPERYKNKPALFPLRIL